MFSRISVVLVVEAKVRGTECLVPPHVDRDPRLLAGVASPASVTVDKGSKISPCGVGMLAPSDHDSVSPVGPYGTLSPSDSDSAGTVGPYGMLSPSESDSVVPVDPYGTLSPSDSDSVDPVGPNGMLSPSDSVAVGPVGPDGTLFSSDLARILFPAVPAGMPFPVGPVGPVGLNGTLFPSDTAAVGPVGPDGRCPHPTLPEYCFRPYLQGYRPLLALLARMGRCPRLTLIP